MEAAVLVFFKQENLLCIKWHLSENLLYISKFIKKYNNITCWKVWKYTYQQTVLSKTFVTLGLKFLLWKNRNFWFQYNSRYVFTIAIMYSCETVWVNKVACIKSMVTVRNYSTNNIMEKNRRGMGGELRIWSFQG